MKVALPDTRMTELEAARQFLEAPSEATFTPLFRLFAPLLLRYFELRGCSKPLAEDLAQETMLAAYRERTTAHGAATFRAWVYGIARNTHLMHIRKEGRCAERVELEGLSNMLRAADADPYSKALLAESLDLLDDVSRRILVLHYLDGLEYHEIAEALRMPQGTVQWKVFDSKKRLARWMDGR